MAPPRLAAVSFKSYLGVAATRSWIAEVVKAMPVHQWPQVELALFPSMALLHLAREALRDSGIALGAQDLAPRMDGAQTGEVTADILAELGCVYAEVGHAERRRWCETDEVVAAKVRCARQTGLVPLLCVGEDRPLAPGEAAEVVARQVHAARLGEGPSVVAYEPVWAIGAEQSAPAEHVIEVLGQVRERQVLSAQTRVIYGGTAGPGTFGGLAQVCDGLFLGRRTHDPVTYLQVAGEIAGC